MTLRGIDLQSDGDLDSIRNSCDVFCSIAGPSGHAMVDFEVEEKRDKVGGDAEGERAGVFTFSQLLFFQRLN